MGYKIGDIVRIRETEVTGVVRSVNAYGNLGVDWFDGDTTPDGMLHPDDVAGIDDTDGSSRFLLVAFW